jgi:hypothetical protein
VIRKPLFYKYAKRAPIPFRVERQKRGEQIPSILQPYINKFYCIVEFMDTSLLYDSILNFISGIADHNADVIKSIAPNNSELIFKEGRLRFMVSGLYRQLFVGSHDVVDTSMSTLSYEKFRHLLYSFDINAQLAKKGYIVVACSSDNGTAGKVDSNWYELKQLSS